MNCTEHGRYNCYDPACRSENGGNVSVSTSGGIGIGIGSGMTINPSTGHLGIEIAPGVSMDI